MDSERLLIERVLSGDRTAFFALVQAYQKLVRHIVARIVTDPHDAEEVFQEVFMRVHRALPNFRQDARLSTWIGRIAHNAAVSDRTRRPRVEVTETDLGESAERLLYAEDETSTTQLDALLTEERRSLVRAHVALLPREQRVAVTLHHLDCLSVSDVGEIMGVPNGTVKSHLFRARQTLKHLLEATLRNE